MKQQAEYDCTLACLCMATGCDYFQTFPADFRQDIERAKGSYGSNLDKAYEYAGLKKEIDFTIVHVGYLPKYKVKAMLLGRRAMVQVQSLNYEKAQHCVYWDGEQVHDPSNKQVYRWIDQITACEYLWLLKEKP